MHALFTLTVANVRSYVRDRAALFWTLAFPLVFIIMFGLIFQGGESELNLAWVDEDGSTQSAELRAAIAAASGVSLEDLSQEEALDRMRLGEVDAVILVPDGYGPQFEANAGSETPGAPAVVTVYTDPSRQSLQGSVYQVIGSVLGAVNLNGRPPLVIPQPETIQTENLNFISYFVPSMLGLSVMQVGIFAAIPLVADREKLILKRLAATPLRRWQLVGSNVLMRLLIALAQSIIIVAVGSVAFGVEITGSLALMALFVTLGAVTFLALGYVVASFASTEDAANGMTSMIQFPMMFLSGTFFPIQAMPDALQAIARIIPLTYLADALRQVMVGGAPFAPLGVCAAVLVGWLVVCFGIASRKFRWQ
jgi:ABC-2 type transport system permease protein